MKSGILKSLYIFKRAKKREYNVVTGKIGLTKLNMPKTQMTIKKSAAASLSNTKSASVFYGVFAQRSLTGSGIHLNNRAFNSASISATRHMLNDNRTVVNNNIVAAPSYTNTVSNGNDTFNYISAGIMGTGVLTQLIAQGIDLFGGTKTTTPTGSGVQDATETTTPPDSEVSDTIETSISGMKEAKDSSILRTAIETANNERTEMEKNLNKLKTNISTLKQEADSAKKLLKDLNDQVEKQEKTVSKNKEAVSQAKESLEGTKRNKENRLRILNDMTKAAGEAAEAHTNAVNARVSAEGKLASAEATLASTPKKITALDGTEKDNPEYTAAQTAVRQAKEQLEKAKQAEIDAKTKWDKLKKNYDNAAKNYDEAVEAFKKADEQYKTAEENLQNAENELKKAKEELENLKEQQNNANNTVEKYEKALKDQEELESKIKDIDSEIKSQQKRLENLEKEEEEELKDVNNKMDKLSTNIGKRDEYIDASDGMNIIEKFLGWLNKRSSNKYGRLTERKAELENLVDATKDHKNTNKRKVNVHEVTLITPYK